VIAAGAPGGQLGSVDPRGAGSGGAWCERFQFLERGEELLGPGPGVLEVELRAASGEREPSGDVQQLVAQSFRFGFGELAFERECLVQTIRSCASITISIHTSFSANALNGNLDRPVSLSSRIRSSTWACWRWRHSMIAMSSSGWSVRIAWKR